MYLTPEQLSKVSVQGERFYGAPIGILQLDCYALFIPGSVGNASTFSVPVRYLTVDGLTVDAILSSEASTFAALVVEHACILVAQGARMITANCGFMARYQSEVQAAVDVPVLLSSLLLAPFLQGMLPASQKLGVLTASSGSLNAAFLTSAGLDASSARMVIAGLDSAPAFNEAFIACSGSADVPTIRDEVVAAASELLVQDPTIGCLLLECSELPPYSAAVQQATGMPVFDFTSLINFFTAALQRTPFQGFL